MTLISNNQIIDSYQLNNELFREEKEKADKKYPNTYLFQGRVIYYLTDLFDDNKNNTELSQLQNWNKTYFGSSLEKPLENITHQQEFYNKSKEERRIIIKNFKDKKLEGIKYIEETNLEDAGYDICLAIAIKNLYDGFSFINAADTANKGFTRSAFIIHLLYIHMANPTENSELKTLLKNNQQAADNPLVSKEIVSCFKLNIIANYWHLKIKTVVPIYENDKEPLRQFQELQKGFYQIILETVTKAREQEKTVSYSITADKKNKQTYFFDPTSGIIKCPTKNASKQLAKILFKYPAPNNNSNTSDQIANHHLRIRRITQIKNSNDFLMFNMESC